MQADVISNNKLEDESYEIVFRTNPDDLIFIGYILEAFEGFAYYTTIDKVSTLVKVTVTEDYLEQVQKILAALRDFKA